MSANKVLEASKTLGFDPEFLHQKYLAERDKRLRDDGAEQYEPAAETLREFNMDPYSPPIQRDPIDEEIDALVMGGGFSGLMTSRFLQQNGVENFRIVEEAGDFGGTWYWNRYPGLRCDVESYIYLPMIEEVGTIPTEKYISGDEIRAHAQRMGEKFDLYDKALFQTRIKQFRWDDTSMRWIVTTDRGDTLRARNVVATCGPVQAPKLPRVPGIHDFKGRIFHTNRWDHEYTGGLEDGRLVGLVDKRVAVVGTAATAIQVIPELARYAKHLYVVQRTPSQVDQRRNRPTDLEWFTNQEPGWQKKRMDNFMQIVLGNPQEENLVDDCWTDVASIVAAYLGQSPVPGASKDDLQQLADFTKMEQIRRRMDFYVKDPEIAEKLKPWYNMFCKRPTFSDEYLQVFNQPNVTLVDTEGKGLERVDETAIYAAGQRIEVDCVICATGFDINGDYDTIGGYQLIGRNGVNLREKWKNGMRTVHGTKIAGFPNFYFVGAIRQAAMGFNFLHTTSRQARHAATMVGSTLKSNRPVFEVSETDEDAWLAELAAKAQDQSGYYTDCTPGYFNNEGNMKVKAPMFSQTFGGGPYLYDAILTQFEQERFS